MSRIVVVTGAGVGLGRAIARRMAAGGDRVVLLGRTAAKVEAAAAAIGDNAIAIGCDVSRPDDVRAAFLAITERFGRVDVLVNNAALFSPFLLAEATDDQILTSVATNLVGPMLCARAAIPLMTEGGHILNLSSESVQKPHPHLVVYQSTKAAVEQFSLNLGMELEPANIRVTLVRAGAMIEADKEWNMDPAATMRYLEAALKAGFDLVRSPISQYSTVAEQIRAIIDLPVDLHVAQIVLTARQQPGRLASGPECA